MRLLTANRKLGTFLSRTAFLIRSPGEPEHSQVRESYLSFLTQFSAVTLTVIHPCVNNLLMEK